jgi:hypothetical protein
MPSAPRIEHVLKGVETMRIRRRLRLLFPLWILFQQAALAQEEDVEGSRDHPLLSRMQDFYISGYEQYGYESQEFYDEQDNEYVIAGRKWVIEYTLKEGFEAPGQLQVRRNYIDAVQKMGGTILFDRGLYMKVASGNQETWIEVWISDHGTDYTLTIVEKAGMKQEVAAGPGLLTQGTSTSPITRPPVQSTQQREVKDAEIERIERALAGTKKNRDKALANLRDISHKVSDGFALAFPGAVCPSPSPAPPVPVPYPDVGKASDIAKGSKRVKIAADKAVALKDASDFKKSESDEAGLKTRALTELIQRHLEKGTVTERDKVSWKNALLNYQDEAATIARDLTDYVTEIEKLLAESKQELGIR